MKILPPLALLKREEHVTQEKITTMYITSFDADKNSFDYRTTFMRQALNQTFWPQKPNTEGDPANDVLALLDLRKEISSAWKIGYHDEHNKHPDGELIQKFERQLAEEASPQNFFYGYADSNLYCEIGVENEQETPATFRDLSDLIQKLDSEDAPHGILVAARSGAGKTVGIWKCVFDTFCTPTANHQRLNRLPVWLPVSSSLLSIEAVLDDKKNADTITATTILEAIAAASSTNIEQLEQRLKHGPPLLLCADLNHVGVAERKIIAIALRKFQARWESRHRLLVVYRSTDENDDTFMELKKGSSFCRYDLQPLQEETAVKYLGNFRNFQNLCYQNMATNFTELKTPTVSDDDIQADCEKLRQLIHSSRYTARNRSGTGSRQESFVSIPLLMNWVSQLHGEELQQVQTVTDLYETIVEKHFQREQGSESYPTEVTAELLEIAMVRIALVMHAKKSLRLSERDCRSMLKRPTNGKKSWWLSSEMLRDDNENRYHIYRFSDDEITAILQHGLLRVDNQGVGFLHDSLVYYFTAVALRYYQDPQSPPDLPEVDDWADAVAGLFKAEPEDWELVTDFLGGMLRNNGEYTVLAERLIATDGIAGLPQLFLRLTASAESHDAIAKALHQSHRRRNWWSLQKPRMFCEELYEQLISSGVEAAKASAARITKRRNEIGTSWLRLMHPRPQSNQQIMDKHQAGITALTTLPDNRIVSGDTNGTVYLWDPKAGTTSEIIQHGLHVRALAVLPDGRVILGCWDGEVRVWDPASDAEPELIIQHQHGVPALAVLPDGWVALGNYDGEVHVWDPASDAEPELIIQHGDQISALAVLPDGQVVSGSWDTTVRVWDPVPDAEPKPKLIIRNTKRVNALAVLPDGRVVLGISDGEVRVWDPASDAEPELIIQHDNQVSALAVLPDGRVASGSSGGEVCVWDPASDAEPELIIQHAIQRAIHRRFTPHRRWVRALMVLPDGRVASGSWDKTVCLWDPASDAEPAVIIQHDEQVLALAVLPDGRIASGSCDKTVRLWDPTSDAEPAVIIKHQGYVRALAVLPDGRVVSGSNDKTVRVWDPASDAEPELIIQHDDLVSALAVLPDGRIASGSEDKTVRLWDPTSDAEPAVIIQHCDSVNALVVLPDGRVVFGNGMGKVRLWGPSDPGAEPTVIIQHEDWGRALSVLPDGRVVSGSYDKTVRLWDPQQNAVTGQLHLGQQVHSLAVDEERSRLVVGLGNGEVLFFAVEPGASLVRLEDES